jgi:hypothetical protein
MVNVSISILQGDEILFRVSFPVSSDPVFMQNIQEKSINHGIGVLKRTVI